MLASGGALVLLATAIVVWQRAWSPRRELVAAIESERLFEPRLTDLSFAPLRKMRGDHEGNRLRLLGAASAILLREDANASTEDLRMRGVAALVLGDFAVAERSLRTAALANPDGWSDLAAAQLVQAERNDDPLLVLDAAVAAQRARRSAAAPAESNFNLGLAMERLGIFVAAGEAFTASLAHEVDPDWRAETARRRDDLASIDEAKAWLAAREDLVQAAARGDAPKIAEIVASFPQQARVWGEGVDLSEWGDSLLRDDQRGASAALQRARMVGHVLRVRSGDLLLADSVAAIDRIGKLDASRLRRVAGAHIAYRDGRIARSRHDSNASIQKLQFAADSFREAGSPMELVARYHVAGTRYDQNELDAVIAELDAIAAVKPERHGYITLAAQTGWERGLCFLLDGSYTAALDAFTRSRSVFERNGEREMTASFDALIAEALDYVGDEKDAWRARARSLAALSRSTNRYRTCVTLATAAQMHVRREEWDRASVILDAVIDVNGDGGDRLLLSHTHAQRSVVLHRLGDHEGSQRDLRDAERFASAITDPGVRFRAEAEIDVARAIQSRETDPAGALTHLTRAIDFFQREQPSHLPRILLERGRLHSQQRRLSDARRDFASGLSITEQARGSVTDLDLRALTSFWSRALYAAAIDAALQDSDPRAAFDLSERARARALLERLQGKAVEPKTLSEIQAALAANSVIVEYADLPEHVVAFVVRHDGLSVVRLSARRSISEAIATMTEASDGDVPTMAAKAADLVFEPVRALLSDSEQIVFVASQSLSRLPFGLLYDRKTRRFLCQSKPIVQTPSATVAILASTKLRHLRPGHLLAISGAGFNPRRYDRLPPLERATPEALAIASLSKRSKVLVDGAARRTSFAEEIETAGVIHYSGHITGFGSDARLLLAGDDTISAKEIAARSMSQTSLVVLAGCRASLTRAPDGVADVATAFLVSGVPVVIATTSDLDDTTAPELLRLIHEEIMRSETVAQAIHNVANRPELSPAHLLMLARMVVLGGSQTLVRDEQTKR